MSHHWKLMGERPGTYQGAFNKAYSFHIDLIKCIICFLKFDLVFIHCQEQQSEHRNTPYFWRIVPTPENLKS